MAPLFHFRRCRPAVSSDSHICPDVWLSVDTDQLFLRTKGRLREGRQKEAPQAPQSTSSLASTTPFSNAGSSRQSTEGQLVSCLWPGMGALRKWQAVFKAKSSAPAPWRRPPPQRAHWSLGSAKWYEHSTFSSQGPPKFSPPGLREEERPWCLDESTVAACSPVGTVQDGWEALSQLSVRTGCQSNASLLASGQEGGRLVR